MHSTYLATCQQSDGATITRIVRVFGKATVDDVRAMLEAHSIEPQEIARAPDKATLDTITATLDGPYQVMYMR